MKNNPVIFVDAAVFRYATDVRLERSARLVEGIVVAKNGDCREEMFLVYESCVREIEGADVCLEKEKSAVKEIAELARKGDVTLVYSHEINLELLFQPDVDLMSGRMFGAPCHMIHSPLLKIAPDRFQENDKSEFPFGFWSCDKEISAEDVYGKIKNEFFRIPLGCFCSRLNFRSFIVGLRETHAVKVNASELVAPFLCSLKSDRLDEILKSLDIGSIKEEKRNNLRLDGYHILSAEKSVCDYFLTTDRHLLSHFRGGVTEVVSPNDFLSLFFG